MSNLGVDKWAQVHGLARGVRGPHELWTNFFKQSMVMSYFWVCPAEPVDYAGLARGVRRLPAAHVRFDLCDPNPIILGLIR